MKQVKKFGTSVARGATFYAFLHKKRSEGRRGVTVRWNFLFFLKWIQLVKLSLNSGSQSNPTI